MGATGLEPSDGSSDSEAVSDELAEGGGAESGAVVGERVSADPDLRALVEAWPHLSAPIRAAVLALIRAVQT